MINLMVTQVSFTTDSDLKRKALEKARKEGITLKTILVYSMKAYVQGNIHFGVMNGEESDLEELFIPDQAIQKKAEKLVKLLK